MSDRLQRDWRRYEFFQLVQLLLRQQEGAAPPGGEGPASRENMRFRPAASLGFAASDVESVETLEPPGGEGPSRFQVTVNFMGLYGPASPLPAHFTEDILWAGSEGEGARDFLDIFHHRLISFLYKSWEKYRYPIRFEPEAPDDLTKRVLCLMGMGTPGMREGSRLALVPLLRTAGLLGSRQRSAAGLECFLASHFEGVEVRVRSCIERWARIPDDQLMRLGRKRSRLGEDACLGARVRDRSSMFRIELGALTLERFRCFLPAHEEFARLVRLTRLYVTDPLDFDVVLYLRAPDVPALRLGEAAALPLGQMSWVAPRGAERGRAELPIREQDPLTSRAAPSRPAAPPAAAPARAPASPPPRVQARPVTTPIPTTRRP